MTEAGLGVGPEGPTGFDVGPSGPTGPAAQTWDPTGPEVGPGARAYVASLGFDLDTFQREALSALDRGECVLVAAPTGSGKTVVAEYATAKALDQGGKAFYTSPLKALSNQKYSDLVRLHGAEQVGLLTGDNQINPQAPIVVMTTEVLRNMLYADSPLLTGLRFVILDEVHYLQDRYRGPVWEEVIIHAAPEVVLVCLSATVSNAEEVADWLGTVRGVTTTVIEERRPVELRQLFLVGDRMGNTVRLLPTLVGGEPNRDGLKIDDASAGGRFGARGGRWFTPRRPEIIEHLEDRDLLPAIWFVFSRKGCEEAVARCVASGVRLTTANERADIRTIVDSTLAHIGDADLAALGFASWLTALEAGVAAHHAGLIPPFKEAVEACFARGLVKVVFATETLALGINMPARSVVIERLSKFTGDGHAPITPGEFTQLVGRAGRRGIDAVGHAIVVWSPAVSFRQAAGLASTRTYALTSAFRPTYNMAANLVARCSPARARHLLNLSFAQFQADRDVVRVERRLERVQRQLETERAKAACELGDVAAYRKGLLAAAAQAREAREHDDARLDQLRPGDIVRVRGRRGGPVVILGISQRKGGAWRVRALTAAKRMITLDERSALGASAPLARIELPQPYAPGSPAYQRQVVASLRAAIDSLTGAHEQTDFSDHVPGAGNRASPSEHDADGLRGDDASTVAACPDLPRHLSALSRVARLERDERSLKDAVKGQSQSLARQFERVLQLLEKWGYVADWSLTPAGERLARIYHELDLVVAEALERGVFVDLDPAAFAGLASALCFEARRTTGAEWFPSDRVANRWARLGQIAADLRADEQALRLPVSRELDPGFFPIAYAWANQERLADILSEEEITGGDFVRVIKLVVDLLRQITVVGSDRVAEQAGKAASALARGVVVAMSNVTVTPDPSDAREAPGPEGSAGPAGPEGSAGPEGPAGPAGTAGTSGD